MVVYAEGVGRHARRTNGYAKWDMKSFAISDYKVTSDGSDTAVTTYKVTVEGTYDGKDQSGVYNAASVWKKHTRGHEWVALRQLERMQEEIDRAIHDATEQFQFSPGGTGFRPDAGYSSSFDLRDRKDHYELRAYLPDVNASDVNVRIDNDRTLHVSVTQRNQDKKNTVDHSTSSLSSVNTNKSSRYQSP